MCSVSKLALNVRYYNRQFPINFLKFWRIVHCVLARVNLMGHREAIENVAQEQCLGLPQFLGSALSLFLISHLLSHNKVL